MSANLTQRKDFLESTKVFLPADGIVLGGDFNFYKNDSDKFGGNISRAEYLTEFHYFKVDQYLAQNVTRDYEKW